jgi:hypothetical protein
MVPMEVLEVVLAPVMEVLAPQIKDMREGVVLVSLCRVVVGAALALWVKLPALARGLEEMVAQGFLHQ